MDPDFDDTLRRPQKRTNYPHKSLTLFQIPCTLCVAPFLKDKRLPRRPICPSGRVVASDRQRNHRMRSIERYDNWNGVAGPKPGVKTHDHAKRFFCGPSPSLPVVLKGKVA